jgi:hypothetical protein
MKNYQYGHYLLKNILNICKTTRKDWLRRISFRAVAEIKINIEKQSQII